jgi:hypothetical protein
MTIKLTVEVENEAAMDRALDAVARQLGYTDRHDPLFNVSTSHSCGAADDLEWLEEWAARREREAAERDAQTSRALYTLDAAKWAGDR